MRSPIVLSAAVLLSHAPALGAGLASSSAAPSPTGIAALVRSPICLDAKISPRGTYVATIGIEDGVRVLTFFHLATRRTAWRLGVGPDGESMPGDFFWANDERVVVELVDRDASVMAAPIGRGEIYAVDATGKAGRLVFGYRAGEMQTGSHIRRRQSTRAWGEIVDTIRSDPRHVLVAARSWDEGGDSPMRLYKVDVYTGVQDLVLAATPVPRAELLADEGGEPRVAFGLGEDAALHYFYRSRGERWRELAALEGVARTTGAEGFDAHEKTLYLGDVAEGGFGLWGVNVETGARRLVASTGSVPPQSLVVDPASGRVIGVEAQPDRPTYHWVDDRHPLARALREVQARYPGEHVRFLNATEDGKRAVVRVYGDRTPSRFLVVDVDAASAEQVAEAMPWIDPARMGETIPFHVAADDGFRIHGYVTLPAARDGALPPILVLPHGGPHGVRDGWGFDPEVQLFASRGFAVLQVNYRGSGGYGDAYEEAGYRRWGSRVVQDIVDATRFAIREGFGDPRRVCILGTSFGAYAALQGAILAPDLFRCAVGISGIYDLTRMDSMGEVAERRLGRTWYHKVVGDAEPELRRASPVHNAARVHARVMLVHGAADRRAPLEHAQALRKALERSGNPPVWLVEPNEGHGFYDVAARERMYARVLAFLRENTAPSTVP